MTLNDISIYLPKYLSDDSQNALIDSLRVFPKITPDKFYTSKLQEEPTLFQGDGIKKLLFINLPNTIEKKESSGIILSNTCDISSSNQRDVASRIVYAPITEMQKYSNWLETSVGKSQEYIRSHTESIRMQYITSIFYLPAIPGSLNDSIVFLDNLLNLPATYITVDGLQNQRFFTLSNYGHYLFLFKLSFHFSRLQEKVDRDQGLFL